MRATLFGNKQIKDTHKTYNHQHKIKQIEHAWTSWGWLLCTYTNIHVQIFDARATVSTYQDRIKQLENELFELETEYERKRSIKPPKFRMKNRVCASSLQLCVPQEASHRWASHVCICMCSCWMQYAWSCTDHGHGLVHHHRFYGLTAILSYSWT